MDGYRIVLFVHLCALLAGISAGALAHFAEVRLESAGSLAALRPWAQLLDRLGRIFPVALVALFLSGAYLVHRSSAWESGWVEASLVGVAALFINGAVLVGGRSRALRRRLAVEGDGALTPDVTRLVAGHIGGVASWANTGLALGIVFVMTTKPGLVGSATALVLAATIGIGLALAVRRTGRHV